MDGDEEVGFLRVGYDGTALQRDENVGFAGIDHAHIGAVGLHQSAKGQGHVEVDVFLFGIGSHSTCIVPAVAGVDDQRKAFVAPAIGQGGEGTA